MPGDEKQTLTAKGEMKPGDGTKRRDPTGETLLKKSMWASRNKFIDSEKENAEMNKITTVNLEKYNSNEIGDMVNAKSIVGSNGETKNADSANSNSDDVVSGFLYDKLQKEVMNLRKYCEFQDSSLNAKDEEIKVKYLLATPLNPKAPAVCFFHCLTSIFELFTDAHEEDRNPVKSNTN